MSKSKPKRIKLTFSNALFISLAAPDELTAAMAYRILHETGLMETPNRKLTIRELKRIIEENYGSLQDRD